MGKKKQAVMLRIPGHHDSEEMQKMAQQVQFLLQQYFDKEVVVLTITEDIHLMSESDIRDFIDTLENIIK